MKSADLRSLNNSFRRALLAQNKAKGTIIIYTTAVRQLSEYLLNHDLVDADKPALEGWFNDGLAHLKPSTVARNFRCLQQFWKWAVEEGEVDHSPMHRMHSPSVAETPPPILTDEQLQKLVKACEGKTFAARRDMAVIRLLLDTGIRRQECAGIQLADLDLDQNMVVVLGKGRRPRGCPFGRRTAQALDRYLRMRDQHKDQKAEALWLGIRGPLSDVGIHDIVTKRAVQAGLPRIHTHLFRHTFAHRWLADGGQEGDLMRLAGWRSRSMLSKYGASAADERAREAHRRMALGDRV